MFSHENCAHPRTKVARAACRREHMTTTSKSHHPAGKGRPGRLPSLIPEKLKPIIDAARNRGLRVSVATDPPDGVEQAFIIRNPRRPDCELIAEAFRAARKGMQGRAEFYHIEGGRSRQLSRARALADVEYLARS